MSRVPVIPRGELRFSGLPGRRSADPLPPGLETGCSVRVVEIPPGPRSPHRHPRSVEIAYVVEGSGRAWEDGRVTAVSAGDLLVIPPGTPHATVATSAGGLRLLCFFPHGDLAANLEELGGEVDVG